MDAEGGPGVDAGDEVGEHRVDRRHVDQLGRLLLPAVAGLGLGRVGRQAGELGPEAVEPGRRVGLAGAEGVGQGEVEPAGDLAERAGLGAEVAAGLLGRQTAGQEVAERRVGQVPGIGRAEQVLPDDGQVGALVAELGELGHDVGEAGLAEHVGDLDVGVGLGMDAAEQLEDEALVVDEGGVGLLHRQRAGHGRRLVGGDLVEHVDGELGVDQRVVPDPAVDLADGDPLLALQEVAFGRRRAAAEHDLVGGPVAAGADRVDEVPGQGRVAVAPVEGGQRDRGGGLVACEPPLPGEEVAQQRCQLLGQMVWFVEAWHLLCLALLAGRPERS